MKYDLHCHTKEGSPDGSIKIFDFAAKLKSLGYSGMLVTDHDTYGGYRMWTRLKAQGKTIDDFYVLKGIEYDTRDGGHVIVVLPDDAKCPLLERRGLKLEHLNERGCCYVRTGEDWGFTGESSTLIDYVMEHPPLEKKQSQVR